MHLLSATADDHEHGYRAAYVSADGLWKLGCYPVLFGVRVVAWRRGSIGCSVDYCAGASPVFLADLLETVAAIFRTHIPDGAEARQVEAFFPGWQQRPIDCDPCWPQLQHLAAAAPEPETTTP